MKEYTTYDGCCPACGQHLTKVQAAGLDYLAVDCPRCGREVILWERVSDHDDGVRDYSGA